VDTFLAEKQLDETAFVEAQQGLSYKFWMIVVAKVGTAARTVVVAKIVAAEGMVGPFQES